MKKYLSHSEKETKSIAKKLARYFKGGDVLGLVGELGSGKTQFVKGLAEYFEIRRIITSPTFVLMKIYQIKMDNSRVVPTSIKQLIHIDCYRINSDEILSIGVDEYLNNKNCFTVIEWAEKVKNILPKNTIWLRFKRGRRENERTIVMSNV